MAYPGGKGGAGVYQRIITLMPPHRVFIEPFLGGGAVMSAKRPAARNIGVDLDGDVVGAWADRPGVEVVHGCGIDFLRRHDFAGDELVYCDPPYLMATRAGRRLYEHELSEAQHDELLGVITGLPCMVMISGYWSPMYADRLKGWTAISFAAMTRGGRLATEWLWFNYPEPVELHDYGFLGTSFRERERIKRKKQRWTARLVRMPILERQALLSAIAELGSADIARSGDAAGGLAGDGDAVQDPGPNGQGLGGAWRLAE